MFHHRSWFPIIVVFLTLTLASVIFSLFRGQVSFEPGPVTVSVSEYQAAVHRTVGSLEAELDRAATDAERAAILEGAREDLLVLVVPTEYKELHLEMVMTITRWMRGVSGDQDALINARQSWDTLTHTHKWIE